MIAGLLPFVLALTAFLVPPAGAEITPKNIRFVEYPDFPDAHSSWGSIGFSRMHRKVFVGVTNHRDRVGLYEYDPTLRRMRLCGFIADLLSPFLTHHSRQQLALSLLSAL